MTAGDIIILATVAVSAILALLYIIKKRKQGGCVGCSGCNRTTCDCRDKNSCEKRKTDGRTAEKNK